MGVRLLTLVALATIALVIYSALSHARRVLLGGESGYDLETRREARLSAVFSLILGVLLLLLLAFLVWGVWHLRAFFFEW